MAKSIHQTEREFQERLPPVTVSNAKVKQIIAATGEGAKAALFTYDTSQRWENDEESH